MVFLNRLKFPALALVTLVTLVAACEKDPTTIGVGVIGGQPFDTDRAVFDVFANNKKIEAVRTNQLPIYQLGVYNHPVYGRTEARITSQVQLSSVNPTFGDAQRSDTGPSPENETIDSVYLYIPFLVNPIANTDLNAPIDSLRQQNVDIDSIYGDREMPFRLRLQRSDYFLRDLDPNTNFQEAQEYFSNQDFSDFVTDEMLFDDLVTISEKVILLPEKDDPATENVNEADEFNRRLPGVRVALDNDFFQRNLLDMEGSSELLNQANFSNFLRGIQFSVVPTGEQPFLFLFDLKNANITVSYSYTAGEEQKTKDYQLNFLTQQRNQQGTPLPVVGNAVNSFNNVDYPPEVIGDFDSTTNAERIYLKGGAGSYAEINLFDDENGREAISQIKANNWIINEANLVFYVDEVSGVINPPRLYLYNAETNGPLFNTPVEVPQTNSLKNYPFYDGVLRGDGSDGNPYRYSVKITNYLNNLVIRNANNTTLGLTLTPNINILAASGAMLEDGTETDLPLAATLSPLGTVLFGSNVSGVNADKKLQLELFYTVAN